MGVIIVEAKGMWSLTFLQHFLLEVYAVSTNLFYACLLVECKHTYKLASQKEVIFQLSQMMVQQFYVDTERFSQHVNILPRRISSNNVLWERGSACQQLEILRNIPAFLHVLLFYLFPLS